jgi:hypothetical protein
MDIIKKWYNNQTIDKLKIRNGGLFNITNKNSIRLLLVGIFGGYIISNFDSRFLDLFKLSTVHFIFFFITLYLKYDKLKEYRIPFSIIDALILTSIIKGLYLLSHSEFMDKYYDNILKLP